MKCKLGDICTKIGSGATPRGGKDAYCDKGITLVRSQNVLDFSFSDGGLAFINEEQAAKLSNVEVLSGDVLLNITGDSVARACMMDDSFLPARVNQHVAILRGKSDIVINRYLLYFLQWQKGHLLQLASGGATRNALTKSMIEQLEIELPSLEQQEKIVDILGSLDDKIALNNKIKDNLEQQLSAIFKSYLLNNMNSIKQIPLSELCGVVTKGTTPTTLGKAFVRSGVNFIKAESILDDHSIDKNKLAFIDEETNKLLKRSIIQAGDIIFTIAGTLGRFALVDEEVLPANTNQAVAIIRVDGQKVLPEYIYSCFIGNWHTDYYTQHTQQAVQANLSLTTIKSLPIPVLEEKEMKAYLSFIMPIIHLIKKNTIQNNKLSAIRDTLLPKLISGEIE